MQFVLFEQLFLSKKIGQYLKRNTKILIKMFLIVECFSKHETDFEILLFQSEYHQRWEEGTTGSRKRRHEESSQRSAGIFSCGKKTRDNTV